MVPSLKVVLRKKALKDGTFPLAIRITVDRKSTYIFLGQSLAESDWDAKQQEVRRSHPNAKRLNNLILQKKAEANDNLLEMETQQKAVSVKVVRQRIKTKGGSSFFELADASFKTLRQQGKYNRIRTEQPQIKVFREFLNDQDITFPEITVGLLTKFKAYLKGTRKVGDATIANYMSTLRRVFSQAIAEGLAEQKHYPFGKGKIKIQIPGSHKIGLSADEVKQLENLDLSSHRPYLTHARNIWLVAFNLAGMRVSDVLRLKHSDFQNGRLYYTMGKNSKPGSVKVSDKVLKIIEQYPKNSKHDLVFPELQHIDDIRDNYNVQKAISLADRKLNMNLPQLAKYAGLTKHLTMHIARHTFGNISGDRIPVQQLQKLYRHSSITTTIGYQSNFIHKDSDEALEAVLNL